MKRMQRTTCSRTVVLALLAVAWFLPTGATFADTARQDMVRTKDAGTFGVAGRDYVEDEIIVKYRESRIDLATERGSAAAMTSSQKRSTSEVDRLKEGNLSVLRITDGRSVVEKLAEYENDPDVGYAEPNYRRFPTTISTNDPDRAKLWGLDNTGQTVNGTAGTADADIDAPEAWAIDEGASNEVIVAVVDTGVDDDHPDLAANMWDGSDCKDENGSFMGGCNHGYDFESGDKTPKPTDSEHGTHVAGIIAAAKDNAKGIIGVAPHVRIMAVKWDFTVSQEVQAIDFARENGAKIINASYGGAFFSQAEEDAISRFRDAGGIFVASAGNSASDHETSHFYPSDHDLDNIISVAATDQDDDLASFSDYGVVSVDVGAPGTNIYSTVPDFVETAVMTQDFDSLTPPALPSGWSKGGSNNNWGTFDLGAPEGVVLYGDLAIPYANNASTRVTLPTQSLSGATGAIIEFDAACDTEYTTTDWRDYMALDASANGSTFTELLRWDEASLDTDSDASGGAEDHLEVSLPSSFLTANFTFRFRWVTNGSVNNFDGCRVDNLVLTKLTIGSGETYAFLSGTSMATPHVVGLAGLIWGFNPSLSAAQVKQTILTTGDAKASLTGKTVSGKRINARSALEAIDPAKAITSFVFEAFDPDVVGTITEETHAIEVSVPYGTVVTALVPTVAITGVSVSPASGEAQDFTSPVTYTVTAADGSTQDYVVTVTVLQHPDVIAVAADKAELVDASIKGANADLANVTVALTDPLPSLGSNGSDITWASSLPGTVSDDGQTVDRPEFSEGDATVTMTATLTKGDVSDTKDFILTILRLAGSPVATVTSAAYVVSTGGSPDETISWVPNATAKATVLAAVAMGEEHQTWVTTGMSDPVVTGDTLVVTSEDGANTVTYTFIVDPGIPLITSVAGDGFITAGEKAEIHVVGTAEADTLVSVTLTAGANTVSGNQQLTGGATAYDIVLDGTAATPSALDDGTVDVAVTATNAVARVSDAAEASVTQDTVLPTVTKKGDGATDFVLPIGVTDLVFSETLSAASKTAVQTALTAGVDATLGYSWTDGTLSITASASVTFANDVVVDVADLAGNAVSGMIIVDSALGTGQVAPDDSGEVTTSATLTEVVVTDPSQAVDIVVASGTSTPTLDVSALVYQGAGTLPAISVTADNADQVEVAIPAGTVVTSADADWGGVLTLPTLTTVTLPKTSGTTKTLSMAVEIGLDDTRLSFSKGVRLLFPGEASKKIGFVRTGSSFTEITSTCAADSQETGDALAANGDCKKNVGGDLVVWTKHFTAFATYTTRTISSGGGGGGGGGGGYAPEATASSTEYLTPIELAAPAIDLTIDGVYSAAAALAANPTITIDKNIQPRAGVTLAAPAGSLVKASGAAVYYYGRDGRRYVFPNEQVFYSWFTDFSSVVVLTDAALAAMPLGGNVTFRPGSQMVKITTDPKTYAVSRGGVLRWVGSERVAASLYGADWNRKISDVSDAFFVNYVIGLLIADDAVQS